MTGLFEGQLDDLLRQKRHTDRYQTLMIEGAAKVSDGSMTRDELNRIVDEYLDQYSKHNNACMAFIATWGENLTLKD
jgi:Mg2+ and Co2+ transporter CorA